MEQLDAELSTSRRNRDFRTRCAHWRALERSAKKASEECPPQRRAIWQEIAQDARRQAQELEREWAQAEAGNEAVDGVHPQQTPQEVTAGGVSSPWVAGSRWWTNRRRIP